MLPVLHIGPMALSTSALATLAGIMAAMWLAEREAGRLGLNVDHMATLIFAGLLSGLVGARLAYVLEHFGAYLADPLSALAPRFTSLSPAEGAIIGVGGATLYGRWRRLPLSETVDALAPGAALMMAALALAHLASGDAFGAPTSAPWRIYLWEEYRHPSQVYELLGALAVLGIWRLARDRRPYPGFNALLVATLSAAARLGLEAFRGDSLLLAGGWRAAQLASLAILVLCLGAMRLWRPKPQADGGSPAPGVEAAAGAGGPPSA